MFSFIKRKKKREEDEGLPKKDGFYLTPNDNQKEERHPWPEYIMTADGPLDVTTKDNPRRPEDRIEIH